MSKIVFAGLESSGKSLRLAMTVVEIAHRNAEWAKKSQKIRPIVSNLKFSEKFFQYVTQELKIPIVYWENLDDLVKMEQCDVIIDEIGNYFDARFWSDLSLDVRRWITQGAKCGIEMYGSSQDFAQVDKAFRRLVDRDGLYEITKLIGSPRPANTRPPVKKIWGVCIVRRLDPRSYNEDKKKFESGTILPKIMFIQRKFCEIFDTTQKIQRSSFPALRHEVRTCEHHRNVGGNGTCEFCKVVHI